MTAYKFATDSESGTIEAASFDEARGILDAMVTDTVGGYGWVEDTDGFRYETNGEKLTMSNKLTAETSRI